MEPRKKGRTERKCYRGSATRLQKKEHPRYEFNEKPNKIIDKWDILQIISELVEFENVTPYFHVLIHNIVQKLFHSLHLFSKEFFKRKRFDDNYKKEKIVL